MAFSLWRTEKDNLSAEKVKQLEEMVTKLEQKLNEYQSTFSNMNKYLQTDEDSKSDRQITDIYQRLQSIHENEELNMNKIHQLENEIHSYKEVLYTYHNDLKDLANKVQELQNIKEQDNSTALESIENVIPEKEQNNVKSKVKKKRNIEFSNKNQTLFLYGNTFGETIQRISSQEKPVKKNVKNQKPKKSKSSIVSGSEYINRYYPKGQTPNHVTSFNPTKYS